VARKNGSKVSVISYRSLLSGVVSLLDDARRQSVRAINSLMTATYLEIGRRIVEFEQHGQRRASYGSSQLARLSEDLVQRFGRGFSVDNLENMRRFYLTYKARMISETASRKSGARKSETLSRKSALSSADHFPPLVSLRASSLGGRPAGPGLLRSRGAARRLVGKAAGSPDFDALLRADRALPRQGRHAATRSRSRARREHFLLELGNDFTFVARQKRLRIGDEWYRIDLLFFHRRLRCLVVIDLKVGKFTHADAGQMNLYLNYVREHWMHVDENPPIGLVLCSKGNQAVAHYALGNLSHKVFTAEYRLALPNEVELAKEIEKTRRSLESREHRLLRPAAAG
jgi:YhcG PDDEXK nuclease domain/DUF1016 N-terminal domain